MAETETRKAVLNITECIVGYRGDDYTIYDIKALKPDGQPVAAKLKSFSEIPLGSAEYEMEKYTNRKQEVSWTIKVDRPRGGGGVSVEEFNSLANRVTALEQRFGVTGSDVTPAPTDDDFLGTSPIEDDDIPF